MAAAQTDVQLKTDLGKFFIENGQGLVTAAAAIQQTVRAVCGNGRNAASDAAYNLFKTAQCIAAVGGIGALASEHRENVAGVIAAVGQVIGLQPDVVKQTVQDLFTHADRLPAGQGQDILANLMTAIAQGPQATATSSRA